MAVKKNPGPKLFFSQFGGEQPIPPEFIAAMEREEEIQAVPDDVGPEELSDTIVESKVETNRTDERVRRTVKKKPGNIVLSKINTNEQGQPVQITRTLFPTGTTPTPPSATATVAVQDLGNGWSIQEVAIEGSYDGEGTFTPSVFPGAVYETSIPDPLPPEFAVLAPTSTSEISSAGTVDTTPDLATGDLSRRESQITQFIKRIRLITRAAVTVPKTLVQTELIDGMLATVTRIYDAGIQTVTAAYLTVEANVRNLGNNTSLKETKTVAAFPQKQGQEFDRQYNVGIPYTIDRKVMGADIGVANKEISPVDFVRADVKTVDTVAAAAIFDAYELVFPGTANLQLPDELLSVTGVIEKSTGDGDFDESATTAYVVEPGGASVSLRGSGQASAAILPDVFFQIRQKWARNVPTTHYLFFLLAPVTEADVLARLPVVTAWPLFNPVNHTFICTGRRLSLQVNAVAQWSRGLAGDGIGESVVDSSGDGASREIGLTIKAVQISPTIHGALSLGGTTSDSEDLTASCNVEVGPSVGARSEFGSISGSISPTSLGATSGATTIPTSGVRLLSVDAEPYRYNYVKIHAETVDFANV